MHQGTVTSIDPLYAKLRPLGCVCIPGVRTLECLSHTQEDVRNLGLDPGFPQWEDLRSMEEVPGRKEWPGSWMR